MVLTLLSRSSNAKLRQLASSSSSRRTSLPALHYNRTQTLRSPLPQPSVDQSLYDDLSKFVFGAVRAQSRPSTENDSVSDHDSVHSLPSSHRSQLRRLSRREEKRPQENEDDISTDEDELIRRLDRAKMRAIDDGTRRPSLPINIPPSHSSHSRHTLHDEDVEMPFVPPKSPLDKPLPALPLVASDPGPQTVFGRRMSMSAPPALEGFDLAFILSGAASLPPPTPYNPALDLAEDSFAKFVDQHDEEYHRTREQWSFFPRQTGVWDAGVAGRYRVKRESDSDGLTPGNAIVVRSVLPAEETNPGADDDEDMDDVFGSPKSKPDSAPVKFHIHKHSRAPAYSLFLGAWEPSAGTKSSILLAPKAVHMHVSSPKKPSGTASAARPTSRQRSFTNSSLKGVREDDEPEAESSSRNSTSNPDAFAANVSSRSYQVQPLPSPSPTVASASAWVTTTRTSHHIAFDTLTPQDSELLLEVMKARPTLGERIKRVFVGATQPHSSYHHHHHSLHHSYSHSNHPSASGHHASTTPFEPSFTPPWMMLAPGYLKEDSERRIRQVEQSFETVGLVAPRKASKRRDTVGGSSAASARALAAAEPAEPERNSVLDGVPPEAMCMAVPLWNYRAEQKGDPATASTSALERKWLLIYYMPFLPSTSPTSLDTHFPVSLSSPQQSRTKKRPRKQSSRSKLNQMSPGLSHTRGSSSLPSHLEESTSASKGAARPTSPGSVTPFHLAPKPLKCFRAVARVLSDAELRGSGLRYPATGPSSASSQPFTFSIPEPASFTPPSHVIAVCHDPRLGIEFIPEGLDRLGLYDGATEGLTDVGREVAEITWAGCLALMQFGRKEVDDF
ncbi:hypothetical protein BOTBODRAFT_207505 [Botryobasidium botryosum FD-172 SS1]|uniref:Uncharacterized protein n=1 Tax=Botryobasidium botryosum (strain FD-172 SS1) TaxID=930990 RepID=A0A067NBR8_BOTB1|nr:hypothetical protein BOTBODRAFT_207505 [Botryobasidium botryosum FD-172 SS1]